MRPTLSGSCLVLAIAATVGAARPASGRVLCQPAAAVDTTVVGHWEAEIQGDSRPFTVTFDFTVKGDTLGGTVAFPTLNRTFDITQGAIRGVNVSFVALGIWRGNLQNGVLYLTRELDEGKTQETVAHKKSK